MLLFSFQVSTFLPPIFPILLLPPENNTISDCSQISTPTLFRTNSRTRELDPLVHRLPRCFCESHRIQDHFPFYDLGLRVLSLVHNLTWLTSKFHSHMNSRLEYYIGTLACCTVLYSNTFKKNTF